MGNGDWWIALAMDWRTSPWMWWRWRFGCESCFVIWCIEVRLAVAASSAYEMVLVKPTPLGFT
jgi:hypothetical protein